MRRYYYRGAARLRVWWSKILGIVTSGVMSLVAAVFIGGAVHGNTLDTSLCFATGFLVIGWTLGLFFFNAYPNVEIDDRGIAIDFLWRKIHLDWSDVVDLRTRGFQWSGFTLVVAKRATPFHVLYSWYFARIIKPGFLISESMDGYTELLETIRRRIRTT